MRPRSRQARLSQKQKCGGIPYPINIRVCLVEAASVVFSCWLVRESKWSAIRLLGEFSGICHLRPDGDSSFYDNLVALNGSGNAGYPCYYFFIIFAAFFFSVARLSEAATYAMRPRSRQARLQQKQMCGRVFLGLLPRVVKLILLRRPMLDYPCHYFFHYFC